MLRGTCGTLLCFARWDHNQPRKTEMGEAGKKDKGRKETQKKPTMTLKEKRKAKNEKKAK
jgi:hypothetical protein